MKKSLSAVAALILCCAAGAETYTLKRDNPQGPVWIGTVEYARTAVISFEAQGHLTFVAPVGRYVDGEVYDDAGNVLKEGGLLAQQGLKVPQADIDIAKIMIERADAVLADSKENYLRYKELAEKNAVSTKDFQEAQMNYSTALSDKTKAELELDRAQRIFDTCTKRAPFNAVVTDVYMGVGGSPDKSTPVLQIGMIDPVRVRFQLPPGQRELLNVAARFLVYPVGSDTPIVGWLEQPVLSTDRIYCYVDNPRGAEALILPDGSALPIVDALNPVRDIAEQKQFADLWVAEETLKSEDGKHFVWLLVPADSELAGADVYTLRKVAVEPADSALRYGYMLLRGIKASSGLKDDDVLAGELPDNPVGGMTVAYRQKCHPFQIGDQVKIAVDAGEKDNGFSIPAEALRPNGGNSGFHVEVLENGQARNIPVALIGRDGNTVRIFSGELKEDMSVTLPD